MNIRNQRLIPISDEKYKVWFNTDLKSIKVINAHKDPNKSIQIFRETWHPILETNYIEKCIQESLKPANYVYRVLFYIKTITKTGNIQEGFIPLPKYAPNKLVLRQNHTNPSIYFLYKVNSEGLFYFK